MNSIDLTGQWQIDDGSSKYDAHLVQGEAHVVGMYDSPSGGHGDIDGFLAGNTFSFGWYQPRNGSRGRSELVIERDGNTMKGAWWYDPGSGHVGEWPWVFRRHQPGEGDGLSRFYMQVQQRLLTNRITDYTKLAPPLPIDLAFSSRGVGPHWGTGQHIFAFTDARYTTEEPNVIFERAKNWFAKAIGGHGAGVLIFIYAPALAATRDEILKNFSVGGVTIYGGVHDLAKNQHWLNAWFGVEEDIFG